MPLRGIIRERYQILEEIGRGGFGIAYRAKDLRVGRDVVVKQLHEQFATDDNNPKARRLFEAEWRTLARLSEHPNIVYLIDLLEEEHAFVMQYISGGNLTELIKERGKLPLLLAVRLMAEVCHGLESAHKLNIVHRDIKPSNILLTADDHAKISDFGIAHHPHDGREIDVTVSGSNLGTINYMAPEQARGSNRITPAADIYAVGSTLYAAVTGRYYLPFHTVKGEFDYETMAYNFKLVKEREPDRPHRYNSAIGPILEGIILRCLAKEPSARYSTIEEVRAALNRVYTMLELELERDYQEAETALTQARWAQALKLYDRILAIDSNYEDAVAHRRLARKWLGPDEEAQPETSVARKPKVVPVPVDAPKTNLRAAQLRNAIFGGAADSSDTVSPKPASNEPVASLNATHNDAEINGSGSNATLNSTANKVESSVQLGPFSVVNNRVGSGIGENESANKAEGENLAVLLWTNDRKLPYEVMAENPQVDSFDDTTSSRRFPAILGWPWLVGGLITAIVLALLGIWLLNSSNSNKNNPVQAIAASSTTIRPTQIVTTAPVIAATPTFAVTPTAPVTTLATPSATALATAQVVVPTELPTETVAATPTALPSPTNIPLTSTPAITPDVKSFAATDSIDSNGNPGRIFNSFLPNDFIFIYLKLGNQGSLNPNQFNFSLYSLPRTTNDKPVNSGTPTLNSAGYLFFEQPASNLKIGNYQGIFTFQRQAIANPIEFNIVTPPPTLAPLPTATRIPYVPPTNTPRPIYYTPTPVVPTIPPVKTTVPETTVPVPTVAPTTVPPVPTPKPTPIVGPTVVPTPIEGGSLPDGDRA